MFFKARLTRYNVEDKEVPHNSREYGYLVLVIEYYIITAQPAAQARTHTPDVPQSDRWIEADGEDERTHARSAIAREPMPPSSSAFKLLVPPIRIKFVPDPLLSVNQIMEFKKLHSDMRMFLSRPTSCSDLSEFHGGCLKLAHQNNKMYLTVCHYTADMTITIENDNFASILEVLDQLCIVVSTNTFFKLDLKEVKNTASKQYNDWRNYLWSLVPKR